jgi:hypothetical protein
MTVPARGRGRRTGQSTTSRSGSRAPRRVAGGLAVGYVAFLAFAVFWPSAGYASGSVDATSALLHRLAVPAWVTPAVVEFVANIVLFVPFGALGSVLLDRWGWRFWLAAGLVASGAIELSQLVFLAGRSATVVDVVSNTLGSIAGAVLAQRVRSRERR